MEQSFLSRSGSEPAIRREMRAPVKANRSRSIDNTEPNVGSGFVGNPDHVTGVFQSPTPFVILFSIAEHTARNPSASPPSGRPGRAESFHA